MQENYVSLFFFKFYCLNKIIIVNWQKNDIVFAEIFLISHWPASKQDSCKLSEFCYFFNHRIHTYVM